MAFDVPIEVGKVREFARATHSTHADHEGTRAVVPPTFLTTGRLIWEPAAENILGEIGFDLPRVLHGREEYIFYGEPPRAGQVLSAQVEVADRFEKEGRRGGTMRFAVIRTSFRSSSGDLVAEQRTTLVETARAATVSS